MVDIAHHLYIVYRLERGQVVEHRQYDSFGRLVRRTVSPAAGAA